MLPSDGQRGSSPTCLVSSIKVEVKRKHHSNGWSFSCFAAHLFEQDLFELPYHVLGPWTLPRGFWFSLPAVFMACSQRSLSVPKPTKQNGGQVGDHGSI